MNKVGKPCKLKHLDFLNSLFRKGRISRISHYHPKCDAGKANSGQRMRMEIPVAEGEGIFPGGLGCRQSDPLSVTVL